MDQLGVAITDNIKHMSVNVGAITKMTTVLGTNKDSADVRYNLTTTIDNTRTLAKTVTQQLKDFSSRGDRKTHQKLTKDFGDWLSKFQEAMKVAVQKERAVPLPSMPSSSSSSSSSHNKSGYSQTGGGYGAQQPYPGGQESPHLNQQNNYNELNQSDEKASLLHDASRRQTLIQLENEREYNETMIADREAGIKKIEAEMADINVMFSDLANLVHEQGFMIDSIESNIESTAHNTTEGVVQLRKASEHQRSARTKMCWLAVIIAVIVAVLAIILLLTLRK
eukprot:TRINITY_DN1310_c1_g1_i2.p1 TRINITY_DN1310_c1_g1~~TRINITY_DN1310_c1_g1_i2.p1  ORF type:complete len:280 (+),score=87.04 TRINITY_DN1310_c1_g1_i2:121-960(+)